MMNFAALRNTVQGMIRAEVERVLALRLQPRLGNVAAYDPKKHAAKVKLQPEGVTTNWIPVGSPWIGNGWGVVTPLSIGEQVKVSFPEFGSNHGVVVARLYDERNPPPLGTSGNGAQPGEFWVVHRSGSLIMLTNDGKVNINGKVEVDVTSPEAININAISGNITIGSVSGNIVISGAQIRLN